MKPYTTLMQPIRGPMEPNDNPDPVVEMIGHNIGKLQTMHAFKMSGIVHPARDKAEERKNANIRVYNDTLNIIAGSLDGLERDYTGKAFRKEVHEWALILQKDGRRKILAHFGRGKDRMEGSAYMDASKAIIDAFKGLKHV